MTEYNHGTPNNQDDLPKLASPARRALAGAGITSLVQLAGMSEADLLQLHGIGPNAIQALRLALQEKGLSFLPDRALADNE